MFCKPDGSGRRCIACGWTWKGPSPWPIRNCTKKLPSLLTITEPTGPGTELHKIIRRLFGQEYAANCGCADMVRRMNAWGPDGCREHVDEIVDKMMLEGKSRKMLAAKLPGARMVSKRVVLMAIRRSERAAAFDLHHNSVQNNLTPQLGE